MEKIKLYEYCIQSMDTLANCMNLPVYQPAWVVFSTGAMFLALAVYFAVQAFRKK